jgi:hypothetical protein
MWIFIICHKKIGLEMKMEKTFELVSSKKERNGKGNASLNGHQANKAELREKKPWEVHFDA